MQHEEINQLFLNHEKEEAERAKKPTLSIEELTDSKFSRNKIFLESVEYVRDLNAQDYISQFILYRMPTKGKYNTLDFLEKQEWNLDTKKFFNAKFSTHAPMFPHFHIISEYFTNVLSKEWKEHFCMVYFSSSSKAYNKKIYELRESEREKKKKENEDDKPNNGRPRSEKRLNEGNSEGSDAKKPKSLPRIPYKPDYTVTKTKKKWNVCENPSKIKRALYKYYIFYRVYNSTNKQIKYKLVTNP